MEWTTVHVQLVVLLTETLLGQVHIDDEEHESSGSFFLSSNKCVHPALKINIHISLVIYK